MSHILRLTPLVRWLDQNTARFASWTAVVGVVAPVMSWVASYIMPIYQYGWGAAVFAGVGLTCIIMLVISGCLVAWRYFNPLPKQLAASNGGHVADASHKVLKEKFVFGGSPPSPGKTLVFPSFQATFGNQGENIMIFVDEIYFYPCLGGQLTGRQRTIFY